MERSVVIAQVLSVVFFVVFVVWFVLRPWRRARHLTLDVLLCLAFQFVFWQDDAMNFIQPQVVFNAALFNRGSWYSHLPGWISPNAELFAWPPLLYLAYTWGLFGGAMLGSWLIGRMKQRWPHASTLQVVATLFAGFLALEFVMEPLILRVGLWSYPGTIGWLTLFGGERYQFPVYEGLLMAWLWTAWSCFRYFRNDRGQTLAERGVERLTLPGKAKQGVRFLALVGACNVIFLGYNIPMILAGLYSGPWPEDIISRSYMTNGICGPGTDYACPGPGVPIHRPSSAHLDPDGRLVAPK
jgi:hypothetical protein